MAVYLFFRRLPSSKELCVRSIKTTVQDDAEQINVERRRLVSVQIRQTDGEGTQGTAANAADQNDQDGLGKKSSDVADLNSDSVPESDSSAVDCSTKISVRSHLSRSLFTTTTTKGCWRSEMPWGQVGPGPDFCDKKIFWPRGPK